MGRGSQSEPGGAGFVNLQRLREAFADFLAEVGWFEDFDFGAVAEQVHKEFAVFRVREFEEITSVIEERAGLLGVPLFAGDPASEARGEAQDSAAAMGAAEDAVAGAQFTVELIFGDFEGRGVGDGGLLDGVDGKAAECVAVVAPGVHVPVIAVVNQALRGNFAPGKLAAGAREVKELEAAAREQGGADGLEVFGGDGPRGKREETHAAHEFTGGAVGAAEEFFQQSAQRGEVGTEQVRVKTTYQVIEDQECLDFGGGQVDGGD